MPGDWGDPGALSMRVIAAKGVSTVVQMVAQLPSASRAGEFLDTQSTAWEACSGKVVTTRDKQTTQATPYRVVSVRTQPHTVIASIDGVPGTPCQHGQHVLQAASDFVLDVSTCGGSVADAAVTISAQLSGRLQRFRL